MKLLIMIVIFNCQAIGQDLAPEYFDTSIQGYGSHSIMNIKFHFVWNSYVEAERKCRVYGGKLASNYTYLASYMQQLNGSYIHQLYWIGVSDIHENNVWVTNKGKTLNSFEFSGSSGNCIFYRNGLKVDDCSSVHYSLCEYFDRVQVVLMNETWNMSDINCRKAGGRLFSNYNILVSFFLIPTNSPHKYHAYWLGITDVSQNGSWVTTAGEHVNLTRDILVGDCITYSIELGLKESPCDQLHFYACEDENGVLICNESQWMCDDNLTCIDRDLVMNGNQDCPDNSDEIKLISCLVREFQCKESNRCIARHKVLDGISDCVNGTDSSDEKEKIKCFGNYEYNNEFQCKNNRCIPAEWVNDGIEQCLDGDDETNEQQTCRFIYSPCADGFQCVPKYKFHDGVADCKDSSDEIIKELFCLYNTRRCKQTKFCILHELFMDTYDNCGDEEDEMVSPVCSKNEYFKCSINGRCIARYWVKNDIVDCFDGEDEFIKKLDCLRSEKRCFGEQTCLPRFLYQNNVTECLRTGYDETSYLQCNDYEYFCKKQKRCILREHIDNIYKYCGEHPLLHFKCHSDEYQCTSGKCIKWYEVTDGIFQCSDGLDEMKQTNCYNNQFLCRNEGKCISRTLVNNGVEDCINGSDENVLLFDCLSSEIQCPGQNRCIPRSLINFGTTNCVQGSNKTYSIQCTANEFLCEKSGRCIPRRLLKDGINDCGDNSDEISTQLNSSMFPCYKNEFECFDGSRCLWSELQCDGIPNCNDYSDELNCTEVGLTPYIFDCKNNNTAEYISRDYFCDGYKDCSNDMDEVEIGFGFKCNITKRNITRRCILPSYFYYTNDEIADCDDEEDINDEYKAFCMNGEIIQINQTCDGVFDCKDLTDECLCLSAEVNQVCENLYCKDNVSCFRETYICDKQSIMPFETICNSVNDCDDGTDEAYCAFAITKERILGKEVVFRCLEINKHLFGHISWENRPVSAVKCNGIPECTLMDDECNANCEPEPWFCNATRMTYSGLFGPARQCDDANQTIISGSDICNGKFDCADKSDERFCSERFECNVLNQTKSNASKFISIHKSKLCDFVIDCFDGLDELGCHTHFYCKNSMPLFINRKSVQNGEINCDDGSDECSNDFFYGRVFSSPKYAIKQTWLRVLVWFMAILSVFGNLFVIFVRTSIFFLRKSRRLAPKPMNIVVLNNAVSDFIMGMYLFALGLKVASSQETYCLIDKAWRTHSLCNFIGFLFMLSTQVSVWMITFMVHIKFKTVFSLKRKYRNSWRFSVIPLTWISMILLLFIPHLSIFLDTFSDTVWISPSAYFSSEIVHKHSLAQIVYRYDRLVLGHYVDEYVVDWATINHKIVQNSLSNKFKILGYFGYFSTYSICIPNLFTPLTSVGSGFSVFLIGLNLALLLYKTALLVSIVRHHIAHNSMYIPISKLDISVAGIIVANCTTSLIMCCIGVASLINIPNSKQAFSIMAIILIPINSALNPAIYILVHLIF